MYQKSILAFLIVALSLGFLGSFHCVGMCGPIALALPLGKSSWGRKFSGVLLYNVGRALTYGVFGLLFGLLGKGFVIGGYQQWLSIGLGVLILVGLLLPSRLTSSVGLFRFAAHVVQRLKSSIGKLFTNGSMASLFTIGLLNGFLPCGLVYMGIAGAIATGDAFKGSMFMMAFGLGTLPAMLAVSVAAGSISLAWRNKIRKAVPVFVGAMALVLILRGMNLGIPYISPELNKTDCTKHSCCSKNK